MLCRPKTVERTSARSHVQWMIKFCFPPSASWLLVSVSCPVFWWCMESLATCLTLMLLMQYDYSHQNIGTTSQKQCPFSAPCYLQHMETPPWLDRLLLQMYISSNSKWAPARSIRMQKKFVACIFSPAALMYISCTLKMCDSISMTLVFARRSKSHQPGVHPATKW